MSRLFHASHRRAALLATVLTIAFWAGVLAQSGDRPPADARPVPAGAQADGSRAATPQTPAAPHGAVRRMPPRPADPGAPTLSATLTDLLSVDVNLDGHAGPGDTLAYGLTVSNTGTGEASGVAASIPLDPKSTLVPGSVNVSPIADDQDVAGVEDAATPVTLTGTDADGNPLTFLVASSPAHGALSGTPPSVTYTPDPNFAGADTFTFTVNDGKVDSNEVGTVTITVGGVNDPPSFTKGPDVTVPEDSGAQTVNPWATAISPGPPDEAGQTVTFDITGNTNAGLFAAGPAVSPTGALTFTPAANANGDATVTLRAVDNGGTAGGGVDTSATQSFVITVTPVNDPPSFTKGADVSVLENSGAQTVNPWATAISPGPADESGQALTFNVTGNTSPGLFAAGPAVSSTGVLTFTPATNAFGAATITLALQDDGGTAGGGADTSASQAFTITITNVNQPPSFAKGPDVTVAEDAGAQTVSPWATAISPGPGEGTQTVAFTVTGNTNPSLFAAGPAVSPTGVLTFTSVADANGSATITLVLQDNGGTADGGVDTSAPQSFVITVSPVNDPPSFTKGPDVTVLEDSGAQTVDPWATAISPGPADEAGQTVSFTITGNTDPALFSAGPVVSSAGVLTFTPAANAFGSATITLNALDSLGAPSAAQSFVITITDVNDPPSFTKGADVTAAEDAGAQTVNPWATAISAGPGEGAQTVSFSVTGNTNPGLFSVAPAVSAAGALTFTSAPNANGTATISLVLQDNGGTADGGADTSASQSFVITVTPVNDPPVVQNFGFDTIANTQLQVAGAKTITPGIFVTGTLLTGATDIDGPGPLTASLNAATAGAVVTVNADGTFTYVPPAGATGTDTFTYNVSDGLIASTGTVTITFKGRVWYVKNDAAAGGLGRSSDPFDTLVESQAASAAGDTIYVYAGSGTTTGQASGITLKASQRLIGQGVALTLDVSVNGGASPTSLLVAGSAPRITNTAAGGDAVTLSDVGGTIEVRGLDISATDVGIMGTTAGSTALTLIVQNDTIRAAGTDGIRLVPNGASAITATVQNDTFLDMTSDSLQFGAATAGSTGTSSFVFSNNTITPTVAGKGGSVHVSGQQATTTSFTASANTFNGAEGNGLVAVDANDNATVTGTINGNTIQNATDSVGIGLWNDSGSTLRVQVTNNQITNVGSDGIQAANFGGTGFSTLSLIVTGNTITNHSQSPAASFVGGVGVFAFEDETCLALRNNVVSGTPGGFVDYDLEEAGGTFTLEEVPDTGATGTATQAYVLSINTGTTTNIVGAVTLSDGASCAAPMLLAGGPRADDPDTTPVTTDDVAAAQAAAIDRLAAAGLDEADRARLVAVPLAIADLPAGFLATSDGGVIRIDRTAAGHGWFVDATPATDEEFPVPGVGDERRATAETPAAPKVDLLTVVAHELGHALGRADLDPSTFPGELMTATLQPGTRRLPLSPVALAARPVQAPAPEQSQAPRAAAMMRARQAGVQPEIAAGPLDVAAGAVPAGKSVTITFQATVDVSTAYASQLSVQATISASNATTVVSDDPATAAPNDPTATPLVYPAPTLDTITPASGSAAGATPVVLAGTGFLDGASVTIGSAATGVDVASTMQINAVTSATPEGTVDVTVTNPDGQAVTLSNGFTYLCSFSLSAPPPPFSPAGGSGTITVTAVAGTCGWSASTGDAWITLTPPASGTGSGTVDYTVAPNPSATPRSGTISVSGQIYTVTQRGRSSRVVDFNGDGLGDALLYRNSQIGPFQTQLSTGAGAFTDGTAGVFGRNRWVGVADFNGDGLSDIFLYRVATGDWTLRLNDGSGGFLPEVSGALPPYRTMMALDQNADGQADVLLVNPTTGKWLKCLTTTPGTFSCDGGSWGTGWTVTPGDLDGDGNADFLLHRASTGNWKWMMSSGAGFTPGSKGVWPLGFKPVVADFDGDGRSDVLRYRKSTGAWVLALTTGSGFTETGGRWAGGFEPSSGDFDGDGRADLFLYDPATGRALVQLYSGGGAFTGVASTWAPGLQLFVTELDGDGRSDVLFYNSTAGAWVQGLTTDPGVFSVTTGTWPAGMKVYAEGTAIR